MNTKLIAEFMAMNQPGNVNVGDVCLWQPMDEDVAQDPTLKVSFFTKEPKILKAMVDQIFRDGTVQIHIKSGATYRVKKNTLIKSSLYRTPF